MPMGGSALNNKAPAGVLRRKFIKPKPDNMLPFEGHCAQILDDIDEWRVCLISAAAGFGKTSLLAHFCQELEGREGFSTLWITLDERDRNPATFARALFFSFGDVSVQIQNLSYGLEEETRFDDMLVEFVNLTDELCDPAVTYCLFIDMYEAASCNEVDELILFLNRNLGENFRFIISSTCFSVAFDDILLFSSVAEVRTNDLVMSGERLETYTNQLLPGLSDDDRAAMREAYGPWPMAYTFAALALKRTSSKSDLRRMIDGYCNRYFQKVVHDQIDQNMQEFLLKTCMLEEMTPDLCDAVTQSKQSAENLSFLVSHNLFCRYDPVRNVYVYETAFRRSLISKLVSCEQSFAGKHATLASNWYASHGMDVQRAKYLSVSFDRYFAMSMVEICTEEQLFAGPDVMLYECLLEYLILTPAERYTHDAKLAWLVLWSMVGSGNVDECDPWLERVNEFSAGHGNTSSSYALAIIYALLGKTEDSLVLITEALEDKSLPRTLQCLLVHMQGEDYERLGDLRKSRSLYQQALSLAERTMPFFKQFDLYLLAHQHQQLGNFEEALRLAHRGLEDCPEDSTLYGEFHGIIAFIQIERGELEEAERSLERALSQVHRHANVDMYIDVQMAQARYQLASGNAHEAFTLLQETVRATAGRHVPRNLDVCAYATLAMLAIENGAVSTIRECADRLDAFQDNPDILRAIPCLLGKLHIAHYEGDYGQCRSLIELCESKVKESGSRYQAARLAAFTAVIEAEQGHTSKANIQLTKAFELAMKGGYVQFFTEFGSSIRGLILDYAANQKGSRAIKAHAKRVLAFFDGGHRPVEADVDGNQGYYSLTDREAEIMHLLNQGMSRTEIAETLNVSQNTVKSHLKNVYSKLGVHSRSEVFRIAQEIEGNV